MQFQSTTDTIDALSNLMYLYGGYVTMNVNFNHNPKIYAWKLHLISEIVDYSEFQSGLGFKILKIQHYRNYLFI